MKSAAVQRSALCSAMIGSAQSDLVPQKSDLLQAAESQTCCLTVLQAYIVTISLSDFLHVYITNGSEAPRSYSFLLTYLGTLASQIAMHPPISPSSFLADVSQASALTESRRMYERYSLAQAVTYASQTAHALPFLSYPTTGSTGHIHRQAKSLNDRLR
ncbi:hypothetical protein BJX70DRAFT_110075 [Aspergillus crustosus]